ncbi:glycoside hydrolase superfamily [Jimgerdemannia flammicorona]|uniref:Glycoside hydrolase superfamily n=1 Tax=Jimgerdemannia flammicorona TaxID=994334 RepID=A0A433QAQ6_9FUNG|nr:glycoside hydrolase superfamily [Jimgerdemannia flammicorona]
MLKHLILVAVTLLTVFTLPAAAIESGVDASSTQSVSAWSCAHKAGFTRAVISCYQEACGGAGGRINPSCLTNYKNAKAAGYTYIDLYMFPCTGYSTCKSPASQVQELVNFVNTNHMLVQKIWLDIEVDSSSPSVGCPNNWKMGISQNKVVAQQFNSAMKATQWKWGIYSSASQWSQIFGSTAYVLNNAFPVWYAQFWDKNSCGSFDENIFT